MSLTGRVIGGRYKLLGLLGQGGMGAVYEAEQSDLHRRVAVKVLRHTGEDEVDSQDFVRFKQEALAAAGLGHPNIVQIFDYIPNDGEESPAIVMELLKGSALSSLVRSKGKLDPSRAVGIMIQVLSALAAAHDARIVHRDVKPENIFVCDTSPLYELVKVLDFGLARPLDEPRHIARTRAGYVLGTPAYMSPEQARGATADVRMDLFAAGVSLYYALAGRRPFEGPTTSALLLAIKKQPPLPLDSLCPEIDLELVRVVEKSLSKDPDARFASARKFIDALAPFASRSPAVMAARAPLVSAEITKGPPKRDQATAPEDAQPKLVFQTLAPNIAADMVRSARFARDGRSAYAVGPGGLARWTIEAGWTAREAPPSLAPAAVCGFAFGPSGEVLVFGAGASALRAAGHYRPTPMLAEFSPRAAFVDDADHIVFVGTRKVGPIDEAIIVFSAGERHIVEPIAQKRLLWDVVRTSDGSLATCGDGGVLCVVHPAGTWVRMLSARPLRALAATSTGGVIAVGDGGNYFTLTADRKSATVPLGIDNLTHVRAADGMVCVVGRGIYLGREGNDPTRIGDAAGVVRDVFLGGGKLRLMFDTAEIVEADVSVAL